MDKSKSEKQQGQHQRQQEGQQGRQVKQKSKNTEKDSFFRKLFGEKERAIELVNAVEGTSYPLDADAKICNLDDSLVWRYNDSAIAVEDKLLVFSEHQSSINPNMPLRLLAYATDVLYTWFVKVRETYKEQIFKIPTPKFYVLYNGEKELDQDVLRLSDAFELEADEFSLELTVKVINVNYEGGNEILEKSPSLKGYAYLVDLIRQNQRQGMSKDKAIRPAIQQCIEEGILADFLQEHFEEVANMLAKEYRFEDELEARAEESMEKGVDKGMGIFRALKDNVPIAQIADEFDVKISRVEEMRDMLFA